MMSFSCQDAVTPYKVKFVTAVFIYIICLHFKVSSKEKRDSVVDHKEHES